MKYLQVIAIYYLSVLGLLANHKCYGKIVFITIMIICIFALMNYYSGRCSFEYRQQPPSTTLQDCNPYNQNNEICITLECAIRSILTTNIRWFREYANGTVTDLGIGHKWLKGVAWHSEYYVNHEYNQLQPSVLGNYWCQVVNSDHQRCVYLAANRFSIMLTAENPQISPFLLLIRRRKIEFAR